MGNKYQLLDFTKQYTVTSKLSEEVSICCLSVFSYNTLLYVYKVMLFILLYFKFLQHN